MSCFYPEGLLSGRAENRAALQSVSALREAMLKETVLWILLMIMLFFRIALMKR